MRPRQRRAAAAFAASDLGLSQRQACRLLQLCRATFRYKSRRKDDTALRELIKKIAARYPRYGQPRIIWSVRVKEGLPVNHKKIERIYREEKLSLRLRKRKRQAATLRVPLPAPTRPNQRWAMDFVFDTLINGRRFKVLTLIDVFTRECLALLVDFSIGGKRLVRLLDEIAEVRGLPEVITMDNGPEFTSRALDEWAHRRGVRLDFIRPGKPVENGFCESFNGKFRDECLNQNQFVVLAEAEVILEAYRREYNEERPHSSLDGSTPAGFAARHTTMLNKLTVRDHRFTLV